MPSFNFTSLVNESIPVSAGLGVDAGNKLTTKDAQKCLKMAANNNYVIADKGDAIEGVLVGVEAHTVNDGFSFGSVKTDGRIEAVVDAAEPGTASVGSFVVAGTSTAIDTAGGCVVELGAGVAFKWRVIRVISGTGVAGDSVLIERV